ncbi:MAG TPA: diacylglycerol kinase family protein [Polyangia bacterium]|nr:diacylglycerol kinase family protein [Polyangia bacterium]
MPGTVVIVNPRSAGGKTERQWPRLREIIHEAYGPFESHFTEAAGDGTRLARSALEGGAELVVAMGGDGTINEVVNGFFDGERAIAPGAAFAVLPAGTGGDFIKSLGTSKEVAAAASALREAKPRAIDVGRLSFVATDGAPAVRHFINIASFGISGLVDRYVNASSKSLGGTVSFAWATLKAGMKYKNASVRLLLDDTPARDGKIYNVAVANGRYFGGGMKVAPDASLDDGLFDVVTMGDMGMGDLLLRGLDIYSGKHLKNPKVSLHRARRVEAQPLDGAEVLLDVDGEQPGRLPATFELVSNVLKVRAN